MTDANDTPEPDRPSVNLKLPQAPVSTDEPWSDDVLDRQELAGTLTNLIRTQSHPFTISIHGHWGTGKTFLLQRWQQDLAKEGFQAIYFNAWEDDFCEDPLLAILGQLTQHFEEDRLSRLSRAAFNIALPLLRQTAQTLLKTTTGVSLELAQNQSPSLLDEYLQQRKTKDELKDHLATLSTAVHDKTKRPLVFIIDELDRCRPTFAIELLEKVKHIFDIEHMVFVFGINRTELARSLHSIYGNIDSDVYLRRFFDIEFTLPEIDGATYCRHVMDRFGLQQAFSALASEANSNVHAEDYRVLYSTFPSIWSRFGLSLRDLEHCVASIALVTKNLGPRQYMFPLTLGLLIPVKVKNQSLYHRFIRHQCLASEVIDYADRLLSAEQFNENEVRLLDRVEAHIYFSENASTDFARAPSSAVSQLRLLADGDDLTNPEYLSSRIKQGDADRIQQMLHIIDSAYNRYYSAGNVIGYIGSLIDLHQSIIRR